MADADNPNFVPLDPELRTVLSPLSAEAIEKAFNSGIPVEVPTIPGVSPVSRVQVIDMDQTASNILANPTPEEQQELSALAEDRRLDWATNGARVIVEKEGYVFNTQSGRWEKSVDARL